MMDSTARACSPGVRYSRCKWPRASLRVRLIGISWKTGKMVVPAETWHLGGVLGHLAILREGGML